MGIFSMQHYPHQAPPPSHLQHHRPPSIVHQQHHPQAAPPQQPSHPSGYASSHPTAPVYQQPNQGNAAQNSTQDGLPYYQASPYSTPSATSGYTSAGKSRFFLPNNNNITIIKNSTSQLHLLTRPLQ